MTDQDVQRQFALLMNRISELEEKVNHPLIQVQFSQEDQDWKAQYFRVRAQLEEEQKEKERFKEGLRTQMGNYDALIIQCFDAKEEVKELRRSRDEVQRRLDISISGHTSACEECAKLEAKNKDLLEAVGSSKVLASQYREEGDRLAEWLDAANKRTRELEADKARLDWLDSRLSNDCCWKVTKSGNLGQYIGDGFANAREAIDDAMTKKWTDKTGA